jgi:hypothetical protein
VNIPDIALERYRLGELDAADADRIRRALAADEHLASRLREIVASDDEIRRDYPAEELARGVMARLEEPRSPSRRGLRTVIWWAVPAAVALVVVAVAIQWAPEDGVRAKGDPGSLVIYRRTNDGSEPLRDNDVVRAGDVVRIGYRASEKRFGTIVSVDGRGIVTRHLPTDGDRAVQLEAGRVVLLDSAFELDDAPTIERFYLITAPAAFDIAPVLETVRRTAPRTTPGLPPSMSVATFSLRKDPTP